jgi:TPR repeat protein
MNFRDPKKRLFIISIAILFLAGLGLWFWQPGPVISFFNKVHLPVTSSMRHFAREHRENAACHAAYGGDLQSMYDCGILLMDDHLNRDSSDRWAREAQGMAMLRKAAEKGHAAAQYELGRYEEQQGVYDEAFRWYSRSARQGYPEAEGSLAFAYWLGQGTAENEEEATHWFQQAAYAGDPMAAESLGQIYRDRGNLVLAYRWYAVAQCYGNKPNVEEIRDKLSPNQIHEAEEAAQSFIKTHPKSY